MKLTYLELSIKLAYLKIWQSHKCFPKFLAIFSLGRTTLSLEKGFPWRIQARVYIGIQNFSALFFQ